jgi:hypothetical protein
LDREGLEAPLPDMPVTAGMIMPMITTAMRGHQPYHEIAQIIVVPRPNRQMKMVGRQAIQKQPNRTSFRLFFAAICGDPKTSSSRAEGLDAAAALQ